MEGQNLIFNQQRGERLRASLASSSTSTSSQRLRTMDFEPHQLPPPTSINTNYEATGRGKHLREVIEEKYLDVGAVSNTNFLEMIKFQNLERFVSIPRIAYEEMVNWFYKHVNAYVDPNGAPGDRVKLIVTFPRGFDDLEYNDIDFFRDFGLVCEGFHYEDLENWPIDVVETDDRSLVSACLHLNRSDLHGNVPVHAADIRYMSGENVLMDKLLRSCIVPTHNRASECSRIRTALLFVISKGEKVNWPIMMTRYMMASGNKKKSKTLPYGSLISHIMGKWRTVAPGNRLSDPAPIDSHQLAKLHIYKVQRALIKSADKGYLGDDEKILLEKAMEEIANPKKKKVRQASVEEDRRENVEVGEAFQDYGPRQLTLEDVYRGQRANSRKLSKVKRMVKFTQKMIFAIMKRTGTDIPSPASSSSSSDDQ